MNVNRQTCVPASLILSACLMLTVASVPQAAAQGKLDAFETDASATDNRHRSGDENSGGCLTDILGKAISDLFEFSLGYGGGTSWSRVADVDHSVVDIAPRALGEPLIPFARTDIAYQTVESDIDALDVRAEAGFGPIGVHVDFTRYWEKEPDDALNIIRTLGLYRMSFGTHVETDLGLGLLTLRGDQTASRLLFSLPVLVHPGDCWGIEFRPAWADRVSDYDIALLLTRNCASLKVGYRWVHSPHESLDGPYAGISIRL